MTAVRAGKLRMCPGMVRTVKTVFRSLFISIPILFLFPFSSQGQITEKKVLDLLTSRSTGAIRAELHKLAQRWPDSPELLYFTALLDSSGENARTQFEHILASFPASPFAAKALFRLGQMDFARGNYIRAAEAFGKLVDRYPHAAVRNEAEYLQARSHLLLGEYNTALLLYQKLLSRHVPETVRQRTQDDLGLLAQMKAEQQERAVSREKPIASKEEPRAEKPGRAMDRVADKRDIFTVQVGSYGVRANAESQKKWFRLRGYPAEIVEYRTRNRLFYRVVIGKFDEREEARRAGERLRRLFEVNFRIAKLDETP